MKASHFIALAAAFAAESAVAQTALVGPGTSYASPFSPAGSVTHDVPGGGLLSITLSNGITSGSFGYWDLMAQGGANISLLGLGLVESGAQTSLTGSSLRFGVSNSLSSLVGALGTGTSLAFGWQATAWFDNPGGELGFIPQTSYQMSFDVNGNNGLLGSVLGVTPSFTFELIDGAGNALDCDGSGTLINIAGLLGTGVTTGTVNLSYTTGTTAPDGPIGIRLSGSALLDATAVGIGTEFATVSNFTLNANVVPEPGGMALILAAGLCGLARRRRSLWTAV
mgnify:CR=1 FL=1